MVYHSKVLVMEYYIARVLRHTKCSRWTGSKWLKSGVVGIVKDDEIFICLDDEGSIRRVILIALEVEKVNVQRET